MLWRRKLLVYSLTQQLLTEIDDKVCSYLVHIASIHNIAKKKSNLTKERIEIECIVYFSILKDESFVHLTLWQMNLHNDY